MTHVTGDTQGRVLYVRRRKRNAPRCPRCGRRLLAGSTRGAVVYYYPACRCVIPNRKMYREKVMLGRRLLAGCVLWCAAVASAVGQMPRAVVTGPKESATGDMIVLDASASEGLSRAFCWTPARR